MVFIFVCFNLWIKYSESLVANFDDVMNALSLVFIPTYDVILSETAISSHWQTHSSQADNSTPVIFTFEL